MRFGFGKTALLIGAAVILAPVSAAAQVRDLDQAQSDVRVFQGSVDSEAVEYRVSVPANTVMQIDVLSTSELDPTLTVRDAGSNEVLAEDDDGGDDLNSRARIAGGETGRSIVIVVDSFDSSWVEDGETYGGSFDLRLSNFVPQPTRAVTYGARETGTVRTGEEGTFTIQGVPGERVEIALIAPEGSTLDPYLELRNASDEVIAFNDDGGNGLNSMLSHVFEEAGTYTIVAKGYGTSTGDYVLRVRDRRNVAAQLPLQVIGLSDEATGELAASWGGETLELSHIDYQLSDAAKDAIRRGDGEVTIRMNALEGGDADFGGDIDPYVEIGFETPLGFAVADSDDDGSGTLNSLLPVDLGTLAQYPDLLDMLRIRVQGFSGTGGAYSLTITPGLEARAEGYEVDAMEDASW